VFTLSPDKDDSFDRSCSIIFADIFAKLIESSIATREKINRSFDYCVFAYLASTALDEAIKTMPRGMGKCRLPCTVVVRLISGLIVDYTYSLLKSFSDGLKACSLPIDNSETETNVMGVGRMSALLAASKQTRDREIDEDKKGEVNRFFGYAIFGVKKKWRKLAAQGDDSNEDDGDCLESEAYSFLDEMSIFHHEAISNQWYLESCYSATDQLRNRGHMTLVAPKYFGFGRKLMFRISSVFNLQIMRQGGRDTIKVAFKTINDDIELWNTFLNCSELKTPPTTKKATLAISSVDSL
jgi:hypothetical protein